MAYPAFPTILTRPYGASAVGSKRSARPSVNTANFGGGYSQRSGNGINSMRKPHFYRSPPLRAANIKTLDDFLTGRRGYMPFMFLVPGEDDPRQFTCLTWDTDYSNQLHSVLTAQFDPNFDP